jgi:hypothetical protein
MVPEGYSVRAPVGDSTGSDLATTQRKGLGREGRHTGVPSRSLSHPRSRRSLAVAAVVVSVVAVTGHEVGWAAPGTSEAAVASAQPAGRPPEDARRGVRYAGLRPGAAGGPCRGQFELPLAAGDVGCTHGPDPAPDGVDVRDPVPVATSASEAAGALATLPCQGDGVSGPRVQLVYAHPAGVADRYASLTSSFQLWAAQVDDAFNLSAAETGGTRHVRYVHGSTCAPTVLNVALSASGDDECSSRTSSPPRFCSWRTP